MPLTRNSSGAAVVDDSSQDIIYEGSWMTAGVREEYLSTTHGTWVSGATAKFAFRGERGDPDNPPKLINLIFTQARPLQCMARL